MSIDNIMIRTMQSGKTAIGLAASMPASAQVPMLASKAGFDWAFIDLEHTLISPQDVDLLANMLRVLDVTPLARIPNAALFDIARLLDSGVQGIIRPHVETAEQARQLVDMCKYAPVGARSWGGASPQLGHPQKPTRQLMDEANRTTLAIVMIESANGIENIDAIANVPGLDGILVGCIDLSVDLDVIGEPKAPAMVEALEKIGRAVNSAGLYFGLGGIPSPEVLLDHPGLTVDFVLAGMDCRILASALEDRMDLWRR
uniref:HpcH/HpaI aldolase family protein n=1 Tax=Pararhizobium sp. IMCC3301 TaxID=3067904 RepID=UPI0027423E69|nr:aldolase/citrate lyase family protein [Pararhizobium sp. IMCC3301]